MSVFTRFVTQKPESLGQGTLSSRYATSRSRIERHRQTHAQHPQVPTWLNATNLDATFRGSRFRLTAPSDDMETSPRKLGKICWTHGKLCCSDQQIVPPRLAETLLHRGVGTERSIPKTFLLRDIPTLCLRCTSRVLDCLNLGALFF